MQKSIALNLKVSVICRAQQITALTAEGITHICLFWLSARALQNNEKTMQSNSKVDTVVSMAKTSSTNK